MKPIFEAKDFGGDYENLFASRLDAIGVANIANAKIEKLLSEAPIVSIDRSCNNGFWYEVSNLLHKRTHTARLIDIQELKREPCGHTNIKPHYWITGEFSGNGKCADCELELVAQWLPKKDGVG